jgi:uncharacterized protein (TIGR03437 family)
MLDLTMRKLAASLFVIASALWAQTAETAYFRAVMLPTNETPATNIDANGVADIIAHVVRDSNGQIMNGTVDFLVRANFPANTNATGLHIHNGAAGAAGPVVIGTPLSGTNSVALASGANTVHVPAQVTGDNTTALTALRGLFDNPSQYYVNIHTTEFPAGAIRGQLQRAVGTVLMGVMSSDNEVPPVPVPASGMAVVVAIASLDASGTPTSGEAYLQTTYNIEDRGTFTGFHIHLGGAGVNGPVAINSSIPQGTAIDSGGTGTVGPFNVQINFDNATQLQTFANLFFNPGADYINIHTNQHAGGVMRAQLRRTDTMTFPITMNSANEVAKTSVSATAPAVITLHTLRNEDGSIAAGTVFFDVNYRFPGAAQFTGLHIHDAPAGTNGPISLPMVPTYDAAFSTDTGFGNYFNWTPGVLNLAVLEDITKNPENHYANIHTSTDAGGAARAQLAAPITAVPAVTSALASNLDKNAATVAPGGLLSLFGTNLAKVETDLSGWEGKTVPASLNGASVTIGGKPAPLLYVSNKQMNVQVPVDVGTGAQPVVVNNGIGPSASFSVNVAQVAPQIFFNPVAAVLKNADFSLVSAANPARAGDIVLVYATGLGTTTPAMPTGALAPATAVANTAPVTATVGGQDADVIYSIAAPGYVGLYQVAVRIPSGVSGNVPVVLQQGTTKSNVVNIAVQ